MTEEYIRKLIENQIRKLDAKVGSNTVDIPIILSDQLPEDVLGALWTNKKPGIMYLCLTR